MVSAAFVALLMLRLVDLRQFVFPWLVLSWILPFPVSTALCAQHADVVSVVFPCGCSRNLLFSVVLAWDTGSNVSSGPAVIRMESELELRQPRCYRRVYVRSCESLQRLGLCAFLSGVEDWTPTALSASTPCRFSQKLLSPIDQQPQCRGSRHSGWIECFQWKGR